MKPLKHLIPLAALAFAHILPAAETNGFAVTFTSADARTSDRLVLPNLWLFVESGRPAAPFLPPGRFTAVFEGSISGDLRADYLFRAEELGGALKLEVNGATVLETTAAGAMSGPVRIRKGTNTVRATFTSPPGGDAFLRVGWAEKGTNSGPIPSAWITHAPTPDLDQAQLLRRGRELFLEQRCAKCHTEKFATPAPELTADSPALDGIGTRRNFAWLAKWIADPKATRARVSMPKLLHGATTKEDAEAVAAYLASLTSSPGPDAGAPPGRAADRTGADSAGAKAITEISKRSGPDAKPTLAGVPDQPVENAERKPLFERLHCAGCHNGPEEGANDPAKISLKHVAAKFGRGPLVEFLLAPERHWAWNPMPNFKLAEIEAKELADHLLKHAEPAETRTAPTGKAVLERGRALVQGSGCLNCHAIAGLENKYSAPPLARLSKEAGGCLAERRDEKSKSPGFTFNASDRRALLAFMKTDLASLSRHAPLEFATRAVRETD
jgi:mono/diheme cytochrome c family protein